MPTFAVSRPIPNFSPEERQYWDKAHSAVLCAAVLQKIATTTINLPYADTPDDKITLVVAEHETTVFHPNHDVAHALRQFNGVDYFLTGLEKDALPHYQDAIRNLTNEERACMQLGAFCFRIGRENEEPGIKNPVHAQRSAQLFRNIAQDLGFSEMLIQSIATHIGTHIDLLASDNTYVKDGFAGAPDAIQHKAKLTKLVMDMSHHVDLVRCFPNVDDIWPFIQHRLDALGNSNAALNATRALEFARKACHTTGTACYTHAHTKETYNVMPANKARCIIDLPGSMAALMSLKNIKKYQFIQYKQHANPRFLFKTVSHDGGESGWVNLMNNLFTAKRDESVDSYRKKWTSRLGQNGYEIMSTKKNNPARPARLTSAQKIGMTPVVSVSYADAEAKYFPPPFSASSPSCKFDTGISLSVDNTQIQRIARRDIISYRKPYDANDQAAAKTYIDNQVMAGDYFTSLDALATSNIAGNNEIMARLHWDENDPCARIMIFDDNLEARLIAQLRALDMHFAVQTRAVGRNNTVRNLAPVIMFYPELDEYTEAQQISDLAQGLQLSAYSDLCKAIKIVRGDPDIKLIDTIGAKIYLENISQYFLGALVACRANEINATDLISVKSKEKNYIQYLLKATLETSAVNLIDSIKLKNICQGEAALLAVFEHMTEAKAAAFIEQYNRKKLYQICSNEMFPLHILFKNIPYSAAIKFMRIIGAEYLAILLHNSWSPHSFFKNCAADKLRVFIFYLRWAEIKSNDADHLVKIDTKTLLRITSNLTDALMIFQLLTDVNQQKNYISKVLQRYGSMPHSNDHKTFACDFVLGIAKVLGRAKFFSLLMKCNELAVAYKNLLQSELATGRLQKSLLPLSKTAAHAPIFIELRALKFVLQVYLLFNQSIFQQSSLDIVGHKKREAVQAFIDGRTNIETLNIEVDKADQLSQKLWSPFWMFTCVSEHRAQAQDPLKNILSGFSP